MIFRAGQYRPTISGTKYIPLPEKSMMSNAAPTKTPVCCRMDAGIHEDDSDCTRLASAGALATRAAMALAARRSPWRGRLECAKYFDFC